MRTCWERTFQQLLDLAQVGWIVFATSDSFYYERKESGPSARVEVERFKQLFQLPQSSTVSSLNLVDGDITFIQTRFSWLTAECGDSIGFKGFFLAILGESSSLATHGDIRIRDARKSGAPQPEAIYTGKNVPAFAIREYPSGGMFVYGCFELDRLSNYKRLLKNLATYRSDGESSARTFREVRKLKRQNTIFKVLIVILTTLVSLLIARDIMGDNWQVYLGSLVFGVVIGVLGNQATSLVDRFIESKE